MDTSRVPHDDHHDQEHGDRPHFCYDGWVFLGRVVELPDGEEEVVHEPVQCKRCRQAK